MARMFGTDGVRGVAGSELTIQLATKLGQAGAYVLTKEQSHQPTIIVGCDTRISGGMLANALMAGICSVGANAVYVGVIPTPAVAYLTRKHKVDAGVVISASHNPMEFNGIKFFNGEGYKLSDALEDEIEELTLEIANTRSITPQLKDDVINEFYEVCLAQQYIAEGGIGYAKELLEKALGAEKAMDVIGKLTASLQVKPFEFVRKADASQILNFIQDEHPQTIALILSYLAPSQSSLILSALPPDRQADVARRVATMDRTSPDVIKEVERVLETQLSSLVNQDYTVIGGVDAVVEILNTVDRGTEKHIMETLEIEDPELADEIRKKMFVFEDILLLDDRAIQRVLRDVENSDLAIALKGSTEQVQNAIFNNLSKRLAAMIQEDMEFMGPVRMKDVEEAQQKIVNIIRKLEDSAEIIISRGGGDEIVV